MRDYERLIRQVVKQGWTRQVSRGGHIMLTSPSGEKIFTSSTPSDHRTLLNLRADLRRRGAVL